MGIRTAIILKQGLAARLHQQAGCSWHGPCLPAGSPKAKRDTETIPETEPGMGKMPMLR
jgi:hypothetical protein